jgi:hypothetical protein
LQTFFAQGKMWINFSLLPRANKSLSQTIHSSTMTLIFGPIFPISMKVFNNRPPDGASTFPNSLFHKSMENSKFTIILFTHFYQMDTHFAFKINGNVVEERLRNGNRISNDETFALSQIVDSHSDTGFIFISHTEGTAKYSCNSHFYKNLRCLTMQRNPRSAVH